MSEEQQNEPSTSENENDPTSEDENVATPQNNDMSTSQSTTFTPHTAPEDTAALPMIGHISAQMIADEIKSLGEFFPKAIEQVLIKAGVDYYSLEDEVNTLAKYEKYLNDLETLAPESADKKTEYESKCDSSGNYAPLVEAERRFKEMWDIKFPQQMGQYPTVSRASVKNPYISLENVVAKIINYTEGESAAKVDHVKNALLSADEKQVETARNGFVAEIMVLKKRQKKLQTQTVQSAFWMKTIKMNQEVHMKYLTDQGLTKDYIRKTEEILNHGKA